MSSLHSLYGHLGQIGEVPTCLLIIHWLVKLINQDSAQLEIPLFKDFNGQLERDPYVESPLKMLSLRFWVDNMLMSLSTGVAVKLYLPQGEFVTVHSWWLPLE